jgi:hypothetical protein
VAELTSKEKEALKLAVEAIYFADNSDYSSYLWRIVTALGGEEAATLLEKDERKAYDKYAGD